MTSALFAQLHCENMTNTPVASEGFLSCAEGPSLEACHNISDICPENPFPAERPGPSLYYPTYRANTRIYVYFRGFSKMKTRRGSQ
jgi:hypothetical protein